jgi:transcriptional regulator with XRE-family HTH domain
VTGSYHAGQLGASFLPVPSEDNSTARLNRGPLAAGWCPAAAERLKLAVRMYGTQEEVAAGSELQRPSLARILNGKSWPRQATLERICTVVGVSLYEVLYGDPADALSSSSTSSEGLDRFSTEMARQMLSAIPAGDHGPAPEYDPVQTHIAAFALGLLAGILLVIMAGAL